MTPESQDWRHQVERDFAELTSEELLAVLKVYVESSDIVGPEGQVALQELRKRLAAEEKNRRN